MASKQDAGKAAKLNVHKPAAKLNVHKPAAKPAAHTHIDENGNVITHTHAEHSHDHGHYHSPDVKKKELNRLSRAIGHLQHVKLMIENDEDCADVLIQLSAVDAALRNLGKEIINEHMTHCIIHAMEDGDMSAVEEFQKAVQKFV